MSLNFFRAFSLSLSLSLSATECVHWTDLDRFKCLNTFFGKINCNVHLKWFYSRIHVTCKLTTQLISGGAETSLQLNPSADVFHFFIFYYFGNFATCRVTTLSVSAFTASGSCEKRRDKSHSRSIKLFQFNLLFSLPFNVTSLKHRVTVAGEILDTSFPTGNCITASPGLSFVYFCHQSLRPVLRSLSFSLSIFSKKQRRSLTTT